MRHPDRRVLIPLSEVASVDQAGSKAVGLADLARNGIPVPETFVIPPSATRLPWPDVLQALGGCVAVRSSATVEDGNDASFAGQFRSFLNIRTVEALARAVRECRDSARGEGVRAYCEKRRVDPSTIRMAVIVQRMLKAEVAGVLFTVHPVRGTEDEMLIEACSGIADELLSGRAPGIGIPVKNGRATCSSELLSTGQVRQLIEMGRRIQTLKGAPQDVEWAIEGGRLWILQARPITRLAFAGIEGQWTNADFRDGGVSSDVVTPLMWSLYEFILDRALNGFLGDLKIRGREFEAARVFFGRPYWNLGAVKQCAMRLPGFVEREFDRDLAVQPTYPDDGARTLTTLRTFLAAIPTVLAAAEVFRTQRSRDLQLLGTDFRSSFTADLRRLEDGELLRRFSDLVERTYARVEENYFRTIFCASIAKQDLRALLGDKPVSYATLVGGLDGLRHFECAQALWEVANRGAGSLDAFLERYGHHSRRELDLRVPRWSEEPEFVAELVRRLEGTESPTTMNQRQRELFRAELDRVRRLFGPWQRRRFERKLTRLRTFLWLREEMRDLSARTYALIPQFAVEIGRRAAASGSLADPTDVFYLSFRELREALRAPMQDRVRERREYEGMYRNFHPPNEVGRGFRLTPVEHDGQRLAGIGCSSGVASGRVAIVRDLTEAPKLKRGDVLVCPFTDPGWTPLLNLAAAVVTENGGLLSHAAVICREYGIPAVLNVQGATRILRDGQIVRVNGEEGYVDVL